MHTDRRAETSDAALHRADGDAHSEAAWCWERTKQARALTAGDLIEELGDAGDELLAALRTGDATLIGNVLLAVHANHLDRMTDRATGLDAAHLTADEAARLVLLQASVDRLKARAEH